MSAAAIETARGTVHAWQCDHMGHVNVRAYGEFFEQACWQLYAAVGITPSRLRSGELNMAAVQQNIAYKAELLAGDVIVVRSRVLEVRERVMRFRHVLANLETGVECADCEFTVVCLDPKARKSRVFPADVAARARALLDVG